MKNIYTIREKSTNLLTYKDGRPLKSPKGGKSTTIRKYTIIKKLKYKYEIENIFSKNR